MVSEVTFCRFTKIYTFREIEETIRIDGGKVTATRNMMVCLMIMLFRAKEKRVEAG